MQLNTDRAVIALLPCVPPQAHALLTALPATTAATLPLGTWIPAVQHVRGKSNGARKYGDKVLLQVAAAATPEVGTRAAAACVVGWRVTVHRLLALLLTDKRLLLRAVLYRYGHRWTLPLQAVVSRCCVPKERPLRAQLWHGWGPVPAPLQALMARHRRPPTPWWWRPLPRLSLWPARTSTPLVLRRWRLRSRPWASQRRRSYAYRKGGYRSKSPRGQQQARYLPNNQTLDDIAIDTTL